MTRIPLITVFVKGLLSEETAEPEAAKAIIEGAVLRTLGIAHRYTGRTKVEALGLRKKVDDPVTSVEVWIVVPQSIDVQTFADRTFAQDIRNMAGKYLSEGAPVFTYLARDFGWPVR